MRKIVISAMANMIEELEYDCDSCENTEMCGSVAEPGIMRNRLAEKREFGV